MIFEWPAMFLLPTVYLSYYVGTYFRPAIQSCVGTKPVKPELQVAISKSCVQPQAANR